MTEDEILQYAFDYIMSVAREKVYNLQFIAIMNYFKIKDNFPRIENYGLNYEDFSKKYKKFCVRDFVYKKDYYSTREMYLIAPSYYLYYTFNVFKYFYYNQEFLNFSQKNIKVFYSGELSFDNQNKISINSNFSNSYKNFQLEKRSFIGGKALVIDIQDFFKSISTDRLIEMLNIKNKNCFCRQSIDNLKLFFNNNNFESLPQLHYSIASSVLSQFYLIDFTCEMNRILIREKCQAVRFVDDMVISLPTYKRLKKVNEVLNELSYFLWENHLNLNSSKTQILKNNDYKTNVDIIEDSYSNEFKSSYTVNKIINDKVDWLLKNQAENLIKFIEELRKCFSSKSVDLKTYHKCIKKYISIDGEHATKVINHLNYSKKWKNLEKKILIKLIEDNTYIFFNPMQFTTFFLLIFKHLRTLGCENQFILDKFLNDLKKKNQLTFREGVMTIQYFLQMKYNDKELLEKMKDINKKYVEFLDEFYNV